MVDKFLVFTPFMAGRMVTTGIEQSQITVLPAWAPDPGESSNPGEDFLFLGRLEEVKGINLLLEAWRSGTRRGNRRLRIAGTGPLEDQVRSMVLKEDGVDYLGYLNHNEAAAEMERCGVVAVPSLWYEGFPLSVVEALAHGRPVMVNSNTSFASALSNEFAWCIQPTVESWRNSIDSIEQEHVEARGLQARKYYVENCSPLASIKSLVELYEDLLRNLSPRLCCKGFSPSSQRRLDLLIRLFPVRTWQGARSIRANRSTLVYSTAVPESSRSEQDEIV
jgi:glycosyltransferase involved in cell wall biosynthesis